MCGVSCDGEYKCGVKLDMCYWPTPKSLSFCDLVVSDMFYLFANSPNCISHLNCRIMVLVVIHLSNSIQLRIGQKYFKCTKFLAC